MKWTPPPGTAGLIFDCDGTLADTMPVHYKAWLKVLTPFGITFPTKRFYELGGVPTSKIIQIIADEQGIVVDDVEGMTVAKETHFLKLLDTVESLAPVVEIASEYRGKLPIAVASGGYRETITKTLQKIGIDDWFDAKVCAEDTEKHKPEPDVFLEAAKRLGVEPSKCVVFEDTDIGLEAAKRAGMLGVDVRPWLPPIEGKD